MSFLIRRANDRGCFDHGWLKTCHTFSFGDYYDKAWTGFRSLRVINEDRIAPGAGFGMHGHRDMEILTYVLDGALRHTDSMGNSAVLRAGECQRMTAGTGVRHSEVNASETAECHLYQIWILPEKPGLSPSYEQKPFWPHLRQNHEVLVAARGGREESLKIHQNAEMWLHRLRTEESATIMVPSGKAAWVQVTMGRLRLEARILEPGDAFATDVPVSVSADSPTTEMMYFLV